MVIVHVIQDLLVRTALIIYALQTVESIRNVDNVMLRLVYVNVKVVGLVPLVPLSYVVIHAMVKVNALMRLVLVIQGFRVYTVKYLFVEIIAQLS
jgi:hypothetical protein